MANKLVLYTPNNHLPVEFQDSYTWDRLIYKLTQVHSNHEIKSNHYKAPVMAITRDFFTRVTFATRYLQHCLDKIQADVKENYLDYTMKASLEKHIYWVIKTAKDALMALLNNNRGIFADKVYETYEHLYLLVLDYQDDTYFRKFGWPTSMDRLLDLSIEKPAKTNTYKILMKLEREIKKSCKAVNLLDTNDPDYSLTLDLAFRNIITQSIDGFIDYIFNKACTHRFGCNSDLYFIHESSTLHERYINPLREQQALLPNQQ